MDDEGYRAIRSPWLRYFFTAVSHRRFNTFNLVDMYRMNVPGQTGPGRLVFDVPADAREWAGEFLEEFGVRSSERRGTSSEAGSSRKDPSPSHGGEGWVRGKPPAPLVAIQPGASKEERRWPPERFGELARTLAGAGCRVLLLGVEGERPSAEIVKRTAGVETIDAVGKTSIDRLGALLENVSLLVTNDTGTMHMASAVGTRVLLLSMCHSNPFETGPYGEGHWAISPRLACYPCEFSTECPDRVCTRMIPAEAVACAAKAMLIGAERVEEGSVWASVDLWRTSFDANGLLRFRPIFKRPLTAERLAQLVYSRTWVSFLFGQQGDAAEEEREDYLGGGLLENVRVPIVRPFEMLAEKAGRGAAAAVDLARLAGKAGMPGDRLEEIESLGRALKELDVEIERLAETERIVSPLVRYFLFLKEAISGADVAGLARQTAGAYADLERLADLSRTHVSVLAGPASGASGVPAHQSVLTA